jgi:NADPH:quinone reductase-like Zn-dependent oxidoreductase
MQYLIDTFRIPRHHIFDSRSSLFLADVMRETNGKGVDIVLNSLSGELLHASWQCVAKFGSMLELGKRDFIGHANLAMDVFQANRSFVGIDLADLFIEKPEAMHR